jgi:hypothetical protein
MPVILNLFQDPFLRQHRSAVWQHDGAAEFLLLKSGYRHDGP